MRLRILTIIIDYSPYSIQKISMFLTLDIRQILIHGAWTHEHKILDVNWQILFLDVKQI
jgi:hypothetical protein